MAQVKLTIQRGKNTLKDITVAAGTAEAQSDTMSLNIDFKCMHCDKKGIAFILAHTQCYIPTPHISTTARPTINHRVRPAMDIDINTVLGSAIGAGLTSMCCASVL
jgi:hypothetical protein